MSEQGRDEYGRMLGKYDGKSLVAKAEEYFEKVDPKNQTVFGLCAFLGISKMTYYRYLDSEDKDLQEAAEWAATRLGEKYEVALGIRGNNPTGPIFMLKQKPFGLKDNQDVEIKGNGTFNIISNIPRPKEK